MSNFDRAGEARDAVDIYIDHLTDNDANEAYVAALEAAGLLAPDTPDLAQPLAEETYEYGVTYIGVNHGGHHIEWVESTGDAEFDTDSLQLLVKRWKKRGQSPKIVRRRISAPEVINE